jgi:hypothetical protein
MARKIASPSPTTATTTLALSSLHVRLEALDKEHQWLLKQIKRKRTELNNFVEQMRSLGGEIFQRCTPGFQKLVGIEQEIHTLFAEIFATRKFGKQTKKDVEGIYRTLQLAGIITPQKSERDDEETELEDLENNEPENDFFGSPKEKHHQHEYEQPEVEFTSRNKTDSSRKIRQTFLSLAEIFHPDKATNGETQLRHTEIMKEINRAYQEGDLARLLEIENQHQVGKCIDINSEDDVTRQCKRLAQENELLTTQYESLKRELALVKNTPEGSMVSDCRKAKRAGIDPISMMLQQVEAEIQVISSIRDFVKDFKEQRMTIKEFLRGPAVLRQMNREMVEDMLERMFIDLEDVEMF